MVEVRAVFCYCLLWLETIDVGIWHMLFHVCCGDCVGVCGNGCCVVVVVENSVLLALEC